MSAPAIPGALLVEPLGDSIHDQTACMVLDALIFPWSSAWFIAPTRRPGRPLWVVRAGAGAPAIGFLAACDRPHHVYVQGLAVDPASRRRGAGRALVRHAALHARGRGAAAIVLHVMPHNHAARDLYEREGFVVTRRVPGFYAGAADALEMRLPLAPTR
ncbi:MAG: GNAT family N-acetyltransferase [Polyangiaceae bacterium]|jgi:ribosomal protein S18 acetylase RimI-like enzyme|nr:GNAT family N-acetyltransferase [Polyangiaceae bacterium]